MAKPTKHATLICTVLTVLALVGILLGIVTTTPLIIIFFLLPAVIYEVYRTEGKSTKWASWGLLILFIAEIILVVFKIDFNLASFLETEEKYVAGYVVPLGDVKTTAPIVMAILSVILFVRTRGRYTKWLAVIIFVTSFGIIYSLDPQIFGKLLRFGASEALQQVPAY